MSRFRNQRTMFYEPVLSILTKTIEEKENVFVTFIFSKPNNIPLEFYCGFYDVIIFQDGMLSRSASSSTRRLEASN